MLKRCSGCKDDLPTGCFAKQRSAPDGLQSLCKDCKREYNHQRRFAPQENSTRLKRCPRCNDDKPATLEHFTACRANPDGLTYLCKVCHNQNVQASRERNPKAYAESIRKWHVSPKGRFSAYVNNTNDRPFHLTFEQFMTFWQQPCSYCDDPIETVGIDRVDSDKDYVLENCVPSCATCNMMKRTMTKERWFAHMRKVLAKADATPTSIPKSSDPSVS